MYLPGRELNPQNIFSVSHFSGWGYKQAWGKLLSIDFRDLVALEGIGAEITSSRELTYSRMGLKLVLMYLLLYSISF